MGNPQMMMQMQMGKGGMPGMGPMGMPGMMRPAMPPMQSGPQGARPMGAMPQQQPAAAPQQQQAMGGGPGAPLNAAALAAAPPAVQKQMIGEKLYPAIAKYQPELAGKVTGMMLEMDSAELLMLLESEQQLRSKVNEA